MKNSIRIWSTPSIGLSLALGAAAIAASCGGSGESGSSGGSGGSAADASASGGTSSGGSNSGGAAGFGATAGSAGSGASGGSGGTTSNYPCPGCQPFPGNGTPACNPSTLAAPTVAYPPDGVLLPPNMNVLEVQFVPPSGATLFEVDFKNSVTDVRVETKCNPITPVRGGASSGCGLTLPQAAWNDIANTNRDGDPLKVSVRATANGACVSTSTDQISINFAKEDLDGGIYYWQSAVYGGIGGKTGGIYSHDFGSFDPTPTPFYTSGAAGVCVGCHNLSRDGLRMSLATDDPDADDELGDVHTSVMEVDTRNVLGGKNMSPGFQTWTHDHAKLIASTFKTAKNQAFDVFDGDTVAKIVSDTLPNMMMATQPDLSRDDKNLVFVVPQAGSIPKQGDHHFMGGALWTASFDASAGTLGTPGAILSPAGTTSYYYPSFSPNGTFLVFDEAPDSDAFWNRKARVKLLHFPAAANATPIDLAKLNLSSDTANSWPRWSPFVTTYKGHKLLWVTFSSDRDYGLRLKNKGFDHCYPPESPAYDTPQPLSKQGVGYDDCAQPQIWMAGIIVDEDPSLDAGDRSFPAFWLPFQDVNSHNFSAQWVEKIYTPPPPTDGGTGTDGGAGSDGGGSCGGEGASCANASDPACCVDTVCCLGSCTAFCIK